MYLQGEHHVVLLARFGQLVDGVDTTLWRAGPSSIPVVGGPLDVLLQPEVLLGDPDAFFVGVDAIHGSALSGKSFAEDAAPTADIEDGQAAEVPSALVFGRDAVLVDVARLGQ